MNIKEQVFKQEVEDYYNFMIDRFENAFRYLEQNLGNEKAETEYKRIIEVVKTLEDLRRLLK